MESKKDVLLKMLERSSAFLDLDSSAVGLQLPEWLLKTPTVTLQIGYSMANPIPDLEVDDVGVRATLSFRQTPFHCVVPWRAVYLIRDEEGKGALFLDAVPQSLLSRLVEPDGTPLKSSSREPAPEPQPQPLPASVASSSPPPPSSPSPSPAAPRKRPNHLKLVK